MREYNTYDKYGLLQGLLDALGKHTSAIPLQMRLDIAKGVIDALPEHSEDIHIPDIPRVTQRERYRQQAPVTISPTIVPTLSPLGAFIAH
ncbi:hypothetical protein J2X66_000376 [Pseudomonas sp. 3296]|nr:hypothetical protein [Pseudomonas sp. 3296]